MTYSQRETFTGWLMGWAAVASITFFVAAGLHDGSGLQEHEHAGSLPAGVAQPFADTYLIENPKRLGPNYGNLCGPNEAKSGVRDSAPVETEDDTMLVLCNDDQHWGVDKGPSPDYTGSMAYMIQNPFFVGGFGGWLAIILGWAGSIAIPARRLKKRQEKLAIEQEAEKKAARKSIAEAKRAALVEAWAQPNTTIDDEEFEKRLGQIEREISEG